MQLGLQIAGVQNALDLCHRPLRQIGLERV